MTTAITFLNDKPEAQESPIGLTAGDTRAFACTFWATPSSPSVAAYRSSSGSGNGRLIANADDPSTTSVFPTTTPSISGNVVTLPTARNFVGGAEYRIEVSATVDSQVFRRNFLVRCRKAGAF